MTVRRMDHVGIVVDDLVSAMAFFSELGLDRQGEWSAEDERVDRIVGLEGVRTDVAMMQTPGIIIELAEEVGAGAAG
jgi:hypothetical protein